MEVSIMYSDYTAYLRELMIPSKLLWQHSLQAPHATCEPSIVYVTAVLNPCLELSENSETCQQENLQLSNYTVETLTNPPQFMTLKIGLSVSNWIYYAL